MRMIGYHKHCKIGPLRIALLQYKYNSRPSRLPGRTPNFQIKIYLLVIGCQHYPFPFNWKKHNLPCTTGSLARLNYIISYCVLLSDESRFISFKGMEISHRSNNHKRRCILIRLNVYNAGIRRMACSFFARSWLGCAIFFLLLRDDVQSFDKQSKVDVHVKLLSTNMKDRSRTCKGNSVVAFESYCCLRVQCMRQGNLFVASTLTRTELPQKVFNV